MELSLAKTNANQTIANHIFIKQLQTILEMLHP